MSPVSLTYWEESCIFRWLRKEIAPVRGMLPFLFGDRTTRRTAEFLPREWAAK
jgi:hypothetical protein